jgi:hypothetical protein
VVYGRVGSAKHQLGNFFIQEGLSHTYLQTLAFKLTRPESYQDRDKITPINSGISRIYLFCSSYAQDKARDVFQCGF